MPNDRRALIVAEAAGPVDAVNAVLARFDFRPAEQASSLAAAMPRLRSEHVDLLLLPLEGLSPGDLAIVEREIRRDGSAFVVGTARQADPALVVSALRAGIHEFITSPADPKELAAAVDRLVRRRTAGPKQGLLLATYSAKGGLGSTSVAVNVGYGLARAQHDSRVVIADFVVLGGDVRVMLDLKPAYDVGDLAIKAHRLDADLLLSLLTQRDGGVWALPSSDNPEVQDLLDAGTATAILAQLRSHFGYVVVDTEHSLTERTIAALDAADRILLVTQMTVQALRSTRRTLQLFERLSYGGQKVLVIANRFNAAEGIAPADAEDVLGHQIFWKLPNDYHACAESLTRGVPVLVNAPDSALGRSYLQLAARLSGATPDAHGNGAGLNGASRLGRLLRLGRK